MNIVTILGTRPEIIRLSLVIRKLDLYADSHTLVFTGQNFVPSLSEVFFRELNVRQPDYILANKQLSLGGQLSVLFSETERILQAAKPDKVLVLGDTNSALSAIVAERMGIPVVHMEAGNRCYDWTVPEEKNRRVIDAIASINMPYTPQSKQNLLREGISNACIVETGNPIFEVLRHFDEEIAKSAILERLQLERESYFVVTVHRAENVDNPVHLKAIVDGLNRVAAKYGRRMICSLHPRTRSRLEGDPSLTLHPLVECYEPFGFFDFVTLEKNACCALTDSGTVQEECCIFHVPTVTIRNSTERPETVDCGSNVVSGVDADRIAKAVDAMLSMPADWVCPEGYLDTDVSAKVVKFLSGQIRR